MSRPGWPSARRPGSPGWLATPPVLLVAPTGLVNAPAALPRLRPHCQFLEVRAADLGFSVEEAATFLGAGMGLRLEWEQVATVVESLTERELAVLRLLGPGRSDAGSRPSCSWSRARSRPT